MSIKSYLSSKTEKLTKYEKFLILMFFVFALVFISAQSVLAYTPAPFNMEMKSIPMMVPFRVWVRPGGVQGGSHSGYYKFLELEMPQPEAEALATPGLTPMVAPITPPTGGAPAIPTM